MGQKEPPRLGSTICYGQTWARKSHQDSAGRFVTAKSWPERAAETRQYDLLRPRVEQKEPPRLGSTICYGQTWARKRPRLGSTICYGQELSRKSNRDSVVRFVTAKSSAVRFVTAKSGPERATKIRQYDLVRPNMGQKGPPRLGSTICYGQKEPPRLGSTICYGQELARKSRRDSAVRCVTAKSWPERATKTRQYDLLQPRGGQKEPPRLGSTICYGQEFGQKEPQRLGSTICYGQELSRKSHRDSAVRFVAAKRVPEKATKTRQYDLLRPNVGQKEPSRLSRKSRQDSAIRFVTAKSWEERATENRQYDL